MKAQMQIDIAIDELFGNIAHYAYHPENGFATVRVEVMDNPMAVVITFMDNGVPYDLSLIHIFKKTVVQQIDSGKNPYILNRISHSRVAMTDGNYVTLLNFKNGDIETNKFDKTEDFKNYSLVEDSCCLLYTSNRAGWSY